MSKVFWKPGTMIYPIPVVMVSCGSRLEEHNIITIAWAGTICTNPALCSISIRPERLSHEIISKNKEFVINLTTRKLAFATDWCGVKSGRDHDKFKEMNLTKGKAQIVSSPIIMESPVNIECKVREIQQLGSHDLFISEVAGINASEKYIEPKTGTFHLDRAEPICYSHGKYYQMGHKIGFFGYSIQKKKKKKVNKRGLSPKGN